MAALMDSGMETTLAVSSTIHTLPVIAGRMPDFGKARGEVAEEIKVDKYPLDQVKQQEGQ